MDREPQEEGCSDEETHARANWTVIVKLLAVDESKD